MSIIAIELSNEMSKLDQHILVLLLNTVFVVIANSVLFTSRMPVLLGEDKYFSSKQKAIRNITESAAITFGVLSILGGICFHLFIHFK